MSDPGPTLEPIEFFPDCVTTVLADVLAARMPEYTILRRPLHPNDPTSSIGLRPGSWTPDESSYEMPSVEPTLNNYTFEIELLIKSNEETRGRALCSQAGKVVRAVLYRAPELQLQLRELEEDLLGTTERFKRLKVIDQRFLGGKVSSVWTYSITTRLIVQTETVPTSIIP